MLEIDIIMVAPSSMPYRAVAVSIGDEYDDDADAADADDVESTTIIIMEGAKKIATAPLMVEPVEERGDDDVWQREREERRWLAASSKFKFLVASVLAISFLVVGGREYMNRRYSTNSSDVSGIDNTQQIFAEDIKDDGGDYFTPLTADEREEMKEMLRSTLRETKNALLSSSSTDTGGNQRAFQQSPQRTLVLDSALPKQFMHMHHMKTGKNSFTFAHNII